MTMRSPSCATLYWTRESDARPALTLSVCAERMLVAQCSTRLSSPHFSPENVAIRTREGTPPIMSELSLFEQLGGEAAVDAAVDAFYPKLLADDLLSPFFNGINI